MIYPARRTAGEFVLTLGACALAYSVFVRPVEKSLADVSARCSALASQGTNSLTTFTPEEAGAARAAILRQTDEIAHRGEPARDESLMFASIMALAGEHRVRVDQVRPTAVVKEALPAPSAPGAPPVPKDIAVGYTISVAATYTDLADFLDGLSRDLGFTVVNSVRLTTDESDPLHPVSAQIETEHHAFDLGTALAVVSTERVTPAAGRSQ